MRKILITLLLLVLCILGRGDCAVMIGFGASAPASLSIKTGTYTGNGTSQSISVGFQPDFIILANNGTYNGVVRFGTQGTGDAAFDATTATAEETGAITSVSASGFAVGSNDKANHSGTLYYWTAFKDNGAGDMEQSSFTGNGSVQTISSLGFDPALVIGRPNSTATGSSLGFKTTGVPSTGTLEFDDYGYGNGKITALGTDEFTVGTYYSQNTVTTHYVAFKAVTGKVAVGSYTGTGASNAITITGFTGITPDSVITKIYATGGTWDAITRSTGMGSNVSCRFINYANLTTGIVTLDSGGFTLGTSAAVNGNGSTYYYMAFKE